MTADLTPEMLASHHEGLGIHRPIRATLHATAPRTPAEKPNRRAAVEEILRRADKSVSAGGLRTLFKAAKLSDYHKILGADADEVASLQALLDDRETVAALIRRLALDFDASVDSDRLQSFKYDVVPMGEGRFHVSSDDLQRVVSGGCASEITWGQITSSLYEYSTDLLIASTRSADVLSSPVASDLAMERVELTLKRALSSQREIAAFQSKVFSDARFFGGAYNSGLLTFDDAIGIIEKSGDLRSWASGLSPTSTLTDEYVRKMGEQSALQKMPFQTARFITVTGAGLGLDTLLNTGGALGIGLSAFDSFVLSRLIDGWKPSTFVARTIRAVEKRQD